MLGRAHSIGARLSRTNVALMHETTQFLGGLKLAAGQNRQADFVNEFEASLAAVKRQQFAFIRQQNLSRRTATIVSGLTGALIAFVGLTIFDTSPPVLIAMLLVFARISAPVLQISQGVQQFAHTLPAYAEVGQLERDLAAAPSRAAGTRRRRHRARRHRVSRRELSLRRGAAVGRRDRRPEPHHRAGQFRRRHRPKRRRQDHLRRPSDRAPRTAIGRHHDRRHAAARPAATAWRDHVSYVVQDPYLFRDTIRRNLLWASPQSSEAEIWDALAIAEADALVAGMPDGLDTVLGERGTLISGGERQRLCLARAVLRQALAVRARRSDQRHRRCDRA